MSFARHYLDRHSIFEPQIESAPANDLGIIVVIPCYNEADILCTIQCLKNCDSPTCSVEVLVVINSGEDTVPAVLHQNLATEKELADWAVTNNSKEFALHVLRKADLPKKHAGAGLARKIGMDEAISRFSSIENPDGVIVSFDADSLCEKNYLREINDHFSQNPKSKACSIYFEHPVSGNEFDTPIYEAIGEYELYLRCYNQALRYTGYPWAYHAVGSCFAVKAGVYAAQGGMNRKQAGEDFYFLQKVIPIGGFFEINSTRVTPSPRPSDRVPFGTGPMIRNLVESGKGIETYQVVPFEMLRGFFSEIGSIFKVKADRVVEYQNKQGRVLTDFLIQNHFVESMMEVNANSPDLPKFKKRFFKWFNAFRILKFLNFASEKEYPREQLRELAFCLARKLNLEVKDSFNVKDLLSAFRIYERTNPQVIPVLF